MLVWLQAIFTKDIYGFSQSAQNSNLKVGHNYLLPNPFLLTVYYFLKKILRKFFFSPCMLLDHPSQYPRLNIGEEYKS
jgi:hypothetical protein